jgi:hypothetical protein
MWHRSVRAHTGSSTALALDNMEWQTSRLTVNLADKQKGRTIACPTL